MYMAVRDVICYTYVYFPLHSNRKSLLKDQFKSTTINYQTIRFFKIMSYILDKK